MIVSFYSVDDENNKVCFKSEAKIENNKIIFKDKSLDNTIINLSIFKDKLLFERIGSCNMKMELVSNQKTSGYYSNDMGLEFKFITNCKMLLITEKRIDIEYDMILDEDIMSSHKIWIILR